MHYEACLLASRIRTKHVVSQASLAFVSETKQSLHYSFIRQRRVADHAKHIGHAQQTRSLSTTSKARRNVLSNIKEFTNQYPVCVFHSRSNNPYHNLAIENHILKYSAPNSRIFFSYTNRPCVVIGRNQNPWLECNIAKIQEGIIWDEDDWPDHPAPLKPGHKIPLDLVRRRSGGGTVIHDAGNLNFSFIVPNDKDFTRDTHGQLVVDVLKRYEGYGRVQGETALFEKIRVNERHDIVITLPGSEKEYKASGSAFKLTRGRALHHGTLLLASPNISDRPEEGKGRGIFSILLASPAKPFLEAKGVGSVPSPVHNLFRIDQGQQRKVLATKIANKIADTFMTQHDISVAPITYVDDHDCHEDVNKQIYDDAQEMMTDAWRFKQTPSFRYSAAHNYTKLSFDVKQGIINSPVMQDANSRRIESAPWSNLEGIPLHKVRSWSEHRPLRLRATKLGLVEHLFGVFPQINLSTANSIRRPPAAEDRIIHESKIQSEAQGIDVVKRKSSTEGVEVETEGDNVLVER